MRAFNDREKEIIKMLAKINLANTEFFSSFLHKNYFTVESKKALFVYTNQKAVLLYLKNELFNELTKRREELGKLFELLSLISYLKEKRYISIYPNHDVLKSELIVMREDFNAINKSGNIDDKLFLNEKGFYIKTSEPENIYGSDDKIAFIAINLGEDVFNLIIKNFMGLLYVSEELIELTERNFKSQEDIRFQKQQIATWISILIAFLLGIWSIYFQLDGFKNKDSEMINLIEHQDKWFDKIDSSIDELNKNLTEEKSDSLNNNL